jgi:hypothetical protein
VAGVRRPIDLGDWVVAIEATTTRRDDFFVFHVVQDLLGRLREWHSSGFYNTQRYAIELHIAADSPHEALRRAVVYHDLAARAVGLTRSSLTWAEVLTATEFQLSLLRPPVPVSPSAPRVRSALISDALISDEMYTATRALLRISTPADIIDLLVGFVTSVGGSVMVGEHRPVFGMVSADISVGIGEPLQAAAEQESEAAMLLEQSLPLLVADARLALCRLREASH